MEGRHVGLDFYDLLIEVLSKGMSRKKFYLDRRRDVFSRSSPLELGFPGEVCLVPILIRLLW